MSEDTCACQMFEEASDRLLEAYNRKEPKADLDELMPLIKRALQSLIGAEGEGKGGKGYTRRDLTFILDVGDLTVERWLKGTGMNPSTIQKVVCLVSEIRSGRPQKPVSVSDTGFVPAHYLLGQHQQQADRIWYALSDHFLLAHSLFVVEAARNIFLGRQGEGPTLVYLYPKNSKAQEHFHEWTDSLRNEEKVPEKRGTIIGVPIEKDGLPWFLPGQRIIMLERFRGNSEADPDVEGYIRIRTPEEVTDKMDKALGNRPGDPRTPWLRIAPDIVREWYIACLMKFKHQLNAVRERKTDPFFAVELPLPPLPEPEHSQP